MTAPLALHVNTGRKATITDFSLSELESTFAELGAPRYRARQLFRGIHQRHASNWSELTDLPAALRTQLEERFRLLALELQVHQRSSDGTEKLLLAAWDGQAIETVHIPAGETRKGSGRVRSTDPSMERRLTVCVSSQAGCALACQFCATGEMGFARNLSSGEIVEQIYRAERPGEPRRVDNVVFMGMGEPLANYDGVVKAIRLLADSQGYGFSPRRITVSTSGLVPQIMQLTEEALEVRLAVSLHASNDALRSTLMPINRRFPIAQLLETAQRYAERSGRRVSYEYVMLDGVNDSDRNADELSRLLHRLDAHVNLIPYNQTSSGFRSSPRERVRAFAHLLRGRNVPCTVRASRGRDIAAACGQLKAENQRVARLELLRAPSM